MYPSLALPLSLSRPSLICQSCRSVFWSEWLNLLFAPLTWMQMWFPSLSKAVNVKTAVWEFVSPADQTPKTNMPPSPAHSETRACALEDVWVQVSPPCLVHKQCKLSIRPILDVFYLRQTCFPYMWCSFNAVRGRSWPSQENLLTSVRRYSLLTWKPAQMRSEGNDPESSPYCWMHFFFFQRQILLQFIITSN